jgi:hypothetical protein
MERDTVNGLGSASLSADQQEEVETATRLFANIHREIEEQERNHEPTLSKDLDS